MANGSKIRVLIADDHAILRAGLRMLIDSQPDMKVIAEAPNGEDAVRLARAERPDVVILDITMPGGGGLRAVPEILKVCASTRVLLLTMHEEPAYLRTALASGAAGYVLKKSVDANLLAAIRSVHKGRSYIDSELASALIQHTLPDLAQPGRPDEVLSERELQVLKLVAEGFSSREIAEQIYIGVKTVETYRARFAEKLGLKSRADLVRYALEVGLLSPERFSVAEKREKKTPERPTK
ncbi:MAG TPA: response regulator transcription factor [Terriglobia bacterium]|nr:response regulator transcription factor [Terriglobia bacterium]